jgi:hypothetical protein
MSTNNKAFIVKFDEWLYDTVLSEEEGVYSTKAINLFNRFYSEYNHEIQRYGEQVAMKNWLSGLALDIPYYNEDILQLALFFGSIDSLNNDKVNNKIINNYFNFIACKILQSIERNNKPC